MDKKISSCVFSVVKLSQEKLKINFEYRLLSTYPSMLEFDFHISNISDLLACSQKTQTLFRYYFEKKFVLKCYQTVLFSSMNQYLYKRK